MKNKSSDPVNALLAIGICVVFYFVIQGSGCFQSRPQSTAERFTNPPAETVPEVNQEELAKAKVVVKPDVKFTIEGNYLYVRGSVINKSSRTVDYWKVTANFLKKGKIIDSDFTNALETLLPGASKRFEIMHENLPGLDDMRLYVEEVQFKD